MNDAAFSRRTGIILGSVMGASLLAFVFVLVWGESAGPAGQPGGRHELESSWSRSAVGHAALRSLLEEIEIPVTVSRFRSGHRAGANALLLLVAPEEPVFEARAESVAEAIESAERVLLVLPKWSCERKYRSPWQCGPPVELRSPSEVESVLGDAGVSGDLVRPERAAIEGEGFPAPRIDRPQLVRSNDLLPVVGSAEGTLLGLVRGRSNYVWILTDPDVLANHGLHRGRNAAFAIRAIERAGDGRRPVLIDETFHGYFRPPQVFGELLRFPLAIALVHLLLLLAALFWAGSGRFGPPQAEPEGIRGGKEVLVSNLAELLLLGGRTADALAKYFRTAVAAVSTRLGIERELTRGEAVERLARIGESRGLAVDVRNLEEEVRSVLVAERFDEGRVISLARAIHRWKKEFLDES